MTWCYLYYAVLITLCIYKCGISASEYYVSAPNGAPCPPNTDCHNLSFYSVEYFIDDTIFYFLEGTHTLQHPLKIRSVSNLTLQGIGHIEQGFHETAMQSTSVIMCGDFFEAGIMFISSTQVTLKSITVTNCGFNSCDVYAQTKVGSVYPQTNVSLCFYNVSNVTLEWLSVQNGSGIGLSLINAFDVLIAKSSFAQNQPYGVCSNCPGGNAYISYFDQSTDKMLYRMDIVESNFTLGLNLQFCETFLNNRFFNYGFGGGLSIEMFEIQSYKVQFCIDYVVLYSNTGNTGANLFFRMHSTNYSLKINNTISTYGTSKMPTNNCTFGAGLTLVQLTLDNFIEPEISVENSVISNNFAQDFGGGVLVFWYDIFGKIVFYNCTIYNNTAHIGSGLLLYLSESFGVSSVPPSFHFKNVLFDSNNVHNNGGQIQCGIGLFNAHNITFEEIEVRNHNITGLMSFQSLLTFVRNSQFVNNSGIFGGGIALYDASYLLVNNINANISFVNNYASYSGGGIYVSKVANQYSYFPCFFQIVPRSDEDYQSTNAKLYFVNNTAGISGDVLYGGNIDYCSNKYNFKHLFHYSQQIGLSVVSSDPLQVCFCESERPNCSIEYINITTIPGSTFNISLAAVGSKNGLTTGVIRLTEYSMNTSAIYELSAKCTGITYELNITNTSLTTTKIYVTQKRSIKDTKGKTIEITIESCPIGFELDNEGCGCNFILRKFQEISCDVNSKTVSRVGNLWIGYENCTIVYPNCPFDYCYYHYVQFTITSPDSQCNLKRSGLLCGQCTEGLSLMLGSNQCGQCSNNYLTLIIPFGLAGIALVGLLIALNLTVSVGTINGLIFYANIVKIYEPIFFPNGPITFLSHFISWLNLDLGIEVCFYNGMNSCSKNWLQFIFPVYVWFLLILIIIMARYSNKVVQLVGTHVVPVLATMILLSYTKLIRAVLQTFYFTSINCIDENNIMNDKVVWYIDANIVYLRGCHLPLFLFSLAVLILLIIPYTFYLLTISLLEGPLSKYMCCCQKVPTFMKPFFDAYGGPYKDKCRFWTGFLLLIRIVLALVVALNRKATSENKVENLDVLISFLVIIIFMYFILRGIYRHFHLVLLEMSFMLNLILMAHLNNRICTVILVSAVFVQFCGIILYQGWSNLAKSRLQQKITKIKVFFKKPKADSSYDDEEVLSTSSSVPVDVEATFVNIREPLLVSEDSISTDYVPFL